MAKEYIEREALIRHLNNELEACGDACIDSQPIVYGTILGLKGAMSYANTLPAADVVEVKHGEWEKRGNEKKCSRCEFIYYSNNDEWSFCPNCGAKMDGERKEEMKEEMKEERFCLEENETCILREGQDNEQT